LRHSLTIAGILAGIAAIAVGGLLFWRFLDNREADETGAQLLALALPAPGVFDASMVQGLPDAARRYFLFTIKPGTPLRTVAEIHMTGEIGVGTRTAPNYLPMTADQILAPPVGLVWKLKAGNGLMQISGSDASDGARSWTRFWLLNLIPVVRAGGDEDHLRSSFGRVAAEAAFWSPAALLPANGTGWRAGSLPNTARAVVKYGALSQELELTVDDTGRPLAVVIQRWSNANPRGVWQEQPFGGTLSEFREFDGFALPTRIEGGNHIGTPEYFPFFKATVSELRFH
jgi:hypothetical protein